MIFNLINDISTTVQANLDLLWPIARKIRRRRRRLWLHNTHPVMYTHLLASMPSIRSAAPFLLEQQQKKEELMPLYYRLIQ